VGWGERTEKRYSDKKIFHVVPLVRLNFNDCISPLGALHFDDKIALSKTIKSS
jgi:hypothetical protein